MMASASATLFALRPSLDAQWLVELLRLKLETQRFIRRSSAQTLSSRAPRQTHNSFTSLRSVDEISARAMRRSIASEQSSVKTVFYRPGLRRAPPKRGTNWQRHESGWPAVQPLKPRPSWVRRQLKTPQALAPPPPAGAWSVLGKRVLEIGGLSHCCSAGGRASAERKSTS